MIKSAHLVGLYLVCCYLHSNPLALLGLQTVSVIIDKQIIFISIYVTTCILDCADSNLKQNLQVGKFQSGETTYLHLLFSGTNIVRILNMQ